MMFIFKLCICCAELKRGYLLVLSKYIEDIEWVLNTIIFCEPLASIILFYATSSIISVLNILEFHILFIKYQKYTLLYSITLTFSASLHIVCITQMTSRQNICTAVQYHFYGVAKSARVYSTPGHFDVYHAIVW
jgi:hypothetical protein